LIGVTLYLKLAHVGDFDADELRDDYFQDPHAYFARMREKAAVTPVTLPESSSRVWMVTRYDDVRGALADPRLYKDWAGKLTSSDEEPDVVSGFLSKHLLTLDPPDHTRLRKLVNKAFTPRRVAGLRPRVEEITAALLDAMESRAAASKSGVVDLIETFAFPLPVTVICELVGIPVEDRDRFQAWSHATVSSVVTTEEFHAAGLAMYQYFTDLVAAKRAAPADDLLSALIQAQDSGDSLDERELIAMLFLLLIAGHETTANLIASGTLALLSHPAERSALLASPGLLPGLLPGAVEELLRYCSPVNHGTDRFTLSPVEIAGETIPGREWVLAVISSANRDPARFPDPDRLDLSRDASGHLAFGHGIHYCLGAPLARLEAEIAFGALLTRFPGLSLAVPESSLRWRPSSLIHGLESLPVRLRQPATPPRLLPRLPWRRRR
jgi:cytochrome P450